MKTIFFWLIGMVIWIGSGFSLEYFYMKNLKEKGKVEMTFFNITLVEEKKEVK